MRFIKTSGAYSLALLLFLASGLAARAGQLPDFTDLVKKVAPAVVHITTTQKIGSGVHPRLPEGMEIPGLPDDLNDLFRRFFEDRGGDTPEHDERSLGSGFIISADGYILTNHHVVDGADEIMVLLSDRRELVAKVIGSDQRSDTALIKIDAKDLPVAKIGSSKNLQVGQWVLAIGTPFGFDHSATAGIISALGRNLPSENYVPFIQTDVAINPGNSGGPLFNLDGEVIGVNSQIYSRTGGYMGLSFAIPIDTAMNAVRQLRSHGRVSRGYLGVLIQDVTGDLAQSFGMSRPEGALVARVMADSPAAKAGIQVGDIIVEFNGEKVLSSAMLPPIVGRTPVGSKAKVRVIREGGPKTLRVQLGELPEDDQIAQPAKSKPSAGVTEDRLGLSIMDITPQQRKQLKDLDHGILVTKVADGGAADKAGVRRGDIVLMINHTKITSAKQFKQVVSRLRGGDYVPMLVQRDGGPMFLPVQIPAK